MDIRGFTDTDMDFVMSIEKPLSESAYRSRMHAQTGYVLWEGGRRVGLLSYCLLWDHLPFLNLLFILEGERSRGFGRAAMAAWEGEMKAQGYPMTLLSTQVDEQAQHLYRKLGYVDCGSLVLHGTPLDQPMEMFMRKIL